MRSIQWKWLAAALVLATIVAVTGRQLLAYTQRESAIAEERASHTMTDAEAGRVYDITHSNTRSGADTDWLIAAANAPGPDGRGGRTPLFAVLLAATDGSEMTPARREALFQIAASLATPPAADGDDSGRQYTAIMLFKKLSDDRALPYLRAMSESTDPLVRFDSRQLIHKMMRRNQTAIGQ